MAAKQLAFDREAWNAMRDGVSKMARAVKVTHGPRGRNAVLDKSWGAPSITKDGVSVAEEIELENPFENMAAQMLKEAASKTSDDAGDGTTTATVLAEAIYLEGLRNVIAGANPAAVKRGLEKGLAAALKAIDEAAEPVKGKRERIAQVASVASNNDAEIGKMIADALDRVGEDGVITVEEGKGSETTVDVVEGMQFDRGFLSPHFATSQEELVCELDKPLILIWEKKITSI